MTLYAPPPSPSPPPPSAAAGGQQVVKVVNDDLYVYKKKSERISNDAGRDFFVNFNTNFLLSTNSDRCSFYIF
jgi:hypothetical protein